MNAALRQFFISSMIICLCYGIAAQRYQWFPAPQLAWLLAQAKLGLGIFPGSDKWYYIDAGTRVRVPVDKSDKVQPGLTMLTGLAADNGLAIKVVDEKGEQVYRWDIDWYKIWPDATHVPTDLMPRSKPGTHIHGSKLMDNGDVVFNFENLGFVRLDACGKTVFRLPYPTHHAVNVDDNGDFWLPGQVRHTEPYAKYPSFQPPFKEDTVVRVSPDGKLLETISVMDLLSENGYDGLMFMSSLSSRNPRPTGDLFHLNDVEVFPSSMKEGVFKHGDVLISLRNINTVLVFDPKTRKIRFLTSGHFVRQHDPDFVDGNTLSVYDNNHQPKVAEPSSRIVLVSALDGKVTTWFQGTKAHPFYSKIMGKHQWLKNGNLLILEALNGKAMELDNTGVPVWSYNNLIEDEGKVGIMEGAERLPGRFDKAFFQRHAQLCAQHQ